MIFNIILLFCYILPMEKGVARHLDKFKSLSSKDTLCQVWLKLAQWFLRRKFLNIFDIILYFCYYLPLEKGVLYAIISHWKRAWPFIFTNLNPLYPRMLCAKFGRNWPSGSGEEVENAKSLQTDRHTDRQRRAKKAMLNAMLHCIQIFTNTCEVAMQACREDYITQTTCTNIHVLVLSLYIIWLDFLFVFQLTVIKAVLHGSITYNVNVPRSEVPVLKRRIEICVFGEGW